MTKPSQHSEWLSLIDHSGPFLAIQVLEEAFPQGLEAVESKNRQRLRLAYEEWRDAIDREDTDLSELHLAWIHLVLRDILEYDSTSLKSSTSAQYVHPENGVIFKPSFAVVSPTSNQARLFISIYPPNTDFDKPLNNDIWSASPIDRMTLLCRSANVQIGIITDGEQWTLINAPVNSTSGYATWYARLWRYEPITLKAFQTLLGVRRCFGSIGNTLESLLDKSLNYHEEITNTLGEQVRRAVEVLIQALDSADQERNRELLLNVSPAELYEAAVTIMMRLVFILCAEERGLLLLGDQIYDQYYAISTLRAQLAEEAGRVGQEILERRQDAWSRLLAVFRAIYGGIAHETLRLAPLGGSLFDPERYPFLEGRIKGTDWRDTIAIPLPIDNRTVLLLLTALQVLEQKTGALYLSYRALDVEQIGHVYEGLLECTVTRLSEITLAIVGSKQAKNPLVPLSQLEEASTKGAETLHKLLSDATLRTSSSINKALDGIIDDYEYGKLLLACGGDESLALRIKPFYKLLRTDNWGSPLVYTAQSYAVTLGADRRETGTHYTPKALTENIVEVTLEPLAYFGPHEGKPKAEWKLKSAAELLELKICDPAMGSAAFLVQACRWLADRLVEAWNKEERLGKLIAITGEVREQLDGAESLTNQLHERLLIAKRLVAEKCLYGVDINPLAVELAKLSIWLITMAKGKPFEFLDHNLKHGDSLFGIYSLDQIIKIFLHPNSQHQFKLMSKDVENAVKYSIEKRLDLRSISIQDVKDIELMSQLEQDAQENVKILKIIADAIIACTLSAGNNLSALNLALDQLSHTAESVLNGDKNQLDVLTHSIKNNLTFDLNGKNVFKQPFHWPLEFPEVFSMRGGFDALIGNPPFIGGRRMRGAIGDSMMQWLSISWPHSSMNADYCAFFYLRAALLLCNDGSFGLLATKTIGQGDTARTGLSHLIDQLNITIRCAHSSFIWPGTASVIAAFVIGYKGKWDGKKFLDDKEVKYISPVLDDQSGWGEGKILPSNTSRCFQGSVLVGMGFVLMSNEAASYLRQRNENQEVVKPYLGGDDLNSNPEQKANRWAIDFRDNSLETCEKRWPELLQHVKEHVKPQRDNTRRDAHKKYWWHHGDKRPALYNKIKNKSNVFVIARITKYVAIVSVSTNNIFNDSLCVFDLQSWSNFSALQSTFHDIWVRRGSNTLGDTLRYTPSDYFDTYPFLHVVDNDLDLIGKNYHEFRKEIMLSLSEGLTDIYNRFHNSTEVFDSIHQLRKMHCEMDEKVCIAYGWNDLELKHDFYETKQGIRFTICEKSRIEVISRLLNLNHQCFDEETSLALTQNLLCKDSKKNCTGTKKNNGLNLTLDLFNLPEIPENDDGKN